MRVGITGTTPMQGRKLASPVRQQVCDPQFGIYMPGDRQNRARNSGIASALIDAAVRQARIGEANRGKITPQSLRNGAVLIVDKSLSLEDVAQALESELGGKVTGKQVRAGIDQIDFEYEGTRIHLTRGPIMEIMMGG